MFHKSLTNLTDVQPSQIKEFLNSFDYVLVDCDGVLWLQDNEIEGSSNVLNKLRGMGKKVFFVTNNSTKTKAEFYGKAIKLGFQCSIEEMFSTPQVTVQYLKELNVKTAYVIGTKAIIDEMSEVGIRGFGPGPDVLPDSLANYLEDFKLEPDVGAVVVGFDPHISYIKLLKAASYLTNPNCHFIATNTDESFPAGPKLIVPGTGTFVSAVATCSDRKPKIMGKPNPFIVQKMMSDYKIEPKRALMIGDRCNTDILLGSNCGFQTLLVLTGVTKIEDLEKLKQSDNKGLIADVYLNKLGDLMPYLA